MFTSKNDIIFRPPDCFRNWVKQNVAGINIDRTVFIATDRLPFQWIPGFRKTVSGMVILNRVYIRKKYYPVDPQDKRTVALLLHELVHVQQGKRMAWAGFLLVYLLLLTKGYWNHPMEVEARQKEQLYVKKYFQDLPCKVSQPS